MYLFILISSNEVMTESLFCFLKKQRILISGYYRNLSVGLVFFFKEINPKRLTRFCNYCSCNKCLERDQLGKLDEFEDGELTFSHIADTFI